MERKEKEKLNADAGNRLRERQRLKKDTNVEAAAKLGLSKKGYEDLCAGKTDFHLDRMIDIDKAYGISPNELAYGKPDSPYTADILVVENDIETFFEAMPKGRERRSQIIELIIKLLTLLK